MKKIVILLISLVFLSQIFPVQTYAQMQDSRHITPDSSSLKCWFEQTIKSLFHTKKTSSADVLDVPVEQFHPIDVTLIDDAFHGSTSLHFTEWWYFDASFPNNYSFQFSIHIYNIFKVGMATVNTNLYHHGNVLEASRDVYFLSDLVISETQPYIRIQNKDIMQGTNSQQQNAFLYHIAYDTGNISFDLKFESLTKGWKGNTSAGSWAVMMPKAIVSGTINTPNSTLNYQGMGYHDHNWNVTPSAGLNYGWAWGKTLSERYTITWASIMETWYKEMPLLVINTNDSSYINIPATDLIVTARDFKFTNGLFIPHTFSIHSKTSDMLIDLEISVTHLDYTSIMGLINYWRYHTHTVGSITIQGATDHINSYDIAEFICFRFY